MVTKQKTDPVLEAAQERAGGDVVVLSTGVRARLKGVAASLVDEVTQRIEDPPIPVWHNPTKDRDEPNPGDPIYLQAVAKVQRQRGLASIDALVMFGVELVDGLPSDDGWIARLKFLEKLGHVDLSRFDLDEPLEREFVYKRFIAVGADDLVLLTKRTMVSPEDVQRAKESFPSS